MVMFKGLSILVLWILTYLAQSKPIGICKTYFSIIGIEGNALNGQKLCSRAEIPFVYFVLKCNDSNSIKCAKKVQWSALSVCDKTNIHHDEIPVTTALNTVDSTELSMELSLFIQTEDEVRSVDEFIINTKVDPNDENLKTFVDSVGKLHNTQLEVEFHRVCSLPDKITSPLQVISYLLKNHPKRRRKRSAATLEYADPGLSELQPSVSSNNGNPYLRDPFPLSQADTDIGGDQINNVQPNQKQTTTGEPFKKFWDKIANQYSKVDTTSSVPSITIGLRNPYVTPAPTESLYPGTSKSRSTLQELLLRDIKVSGSVNQNTSTVSPTTSSSSRVTPRFITRPAVTTPSTITASSSSPTTSATTSPTTTTTRKPTTTESQTSSPTSSTTTSTTTTTKKSTTPLTTSTTSTSSPTTTSTLPTTVTSIRPPTTTTSTSTSPTTEKQQQTTVSTETQSTSTSTISAASTGSPKITVPVSTERATLKPIIDKTTDEQETTTTKEENVTDNRNSTEPSINSPLPSNETTTSTSSSSSMMGSNGSDTGGGDDNFWPIVAAMVIGIPSVIVFAIAITVIHKKRSMERPRRGSSLHLQGPYVRNIAARNSISV